MKWTGLLLFLFTFLFLTNSVFAVCAPFRARIKSINPIYDCLDIINTDGCGGWIKITNHCKGRFYFYNEDGSLDKSFTLVNFEEWDKTGRKDTSKMGFTHRQNEARVGAVDSTNLKYGDVVKEWEMRIYSVDNDEDIVVKGNTIYVGRSSSVTKENDYKNIFGDLANLVLIIVPALLLFGFLSLSLIRRKKKYPD